MEFLRTPDQGLAPHGDKIPKFGLEVALEGVEDPSERDKILAENRQRNIEHNAALLGTSAAFDLDIRFSGPSAS